MRHKQQAKAPLKSCSCRSHWHLLECTIASFAVSIPYFAQRFPSRIVRRADGPSQTESDFAAERSEAQGRGTRMVWQDRQDRAGPRRIPFILSSCHPVLMRGVWGRGAGWIPLSVSVRVCPVCPWFSAAGRRLPTGPARGFTEREGPRAGPSVHTRRGPARNPRQGDATRTSWCSRARRSGGRPCRRGRRG